MTEVVVCIKERIPKKWTMEKMITYFTKKAKKKKYFLKDRYINKKMKVSTWVLLQNISERTYARKCLERTLFSICVLLISDID